MPGEVVPFLGRVLHIELEDTTSSRVKIALGLSTLNVMVPSKLSAESRDATVRVALVRWYRERAAEHLAVQTTQWAAVMGLQPNEVRIRDQRRRWGSCGRNGTIR